jgi:hypothetical protein
VLANATATGATGLGVLYLAWAFGATLGLSEGVAARRTIVGSMINGLDGVLMMAGAAGVGLMMGLLIAFLVAERHEASSTAQLVD